MNRRLLLIPVVGVAGILAAGQLVDDGEIQYDDPFIPSIVGDRAEGWADDPWAVNRHVGDPFDPTPVYAQLEADLFDDLAPSDGLEVDPAAIDAIDTDG